MSAVAFFATGMHGHVNPLLPVVTRLAAQGHDVTFHAERAFADEIEAAGARVRPYPDGAAEESRPPEPVTYIARISGRAVQVLPGVLAHVGRDRPDLVVHDAACLWAPVAARAVGAPTVAAFTTFAYDRRVPSPTATSPALAAAALTHPSSVARYARARAALRWRYGARGLPAVDVLDVRGRVNLVFTSPEVQPAAGSFDGSYRFVGPSVGSRPPAGPPLGELRDPVVLASLGTVYTTDRALLRAFVGALAPLAGSLVLATGRTDPASLGPLPPHVVARRFVPQPEVLARAALFVTHAGANSVNEALAAGVPMVLVPQGADQPMVAHRVAELGAGVVLEGRGIGRDAVHGAARRVLGDPAFRGAAEGLRRAQHDAGGAARAVREIEDVLAQVGTR
ncbi:macrolide family glycosyltransferase [Actinomycetospora sp. CA-101289]|uniref:macrolide family glycosyltransferase n=1 Tax=Actinomycetospora sp. CA-101289 TaxID=3239893 RepID=UPI003D966488